MTKFHAMPNPVANPNPNRAARMMSWTLIDMCGDEVLRLYLRLTEVLRRTVVRAE